MVLRVLLYKMSALMEREFKRMRDFQTDGGRKLPTCGGEKKKKKKKKKEKRFQGMKTIGKVREEEEEEGEVWRREIMMGEKCQPLEFSGVIYYDGDGRRVAAAPRSELRRQLPWGEL
ncbi:hypothetical protein AXF42_Ash006721 [Apostasia shenzhenica]|uniref:Uncharacterized protein n=1 Tax=Apostasia shenzhenica TaxID=1088818 RepID=A0A2I0AIZ2_9ASPA|nr:hypothetical protein AXF42_Ash006721 [Apostasia shenzhenica]